MLSEKTKDHFREIAAIDLGSNSFHMIIAKVTHHDLQIISRHKQRVRLAEGLNKSLVLDQAAMNRGIECLDLFADRLKDFEPENVRIAATHTLRQAKNASTFLKYAKKIIPFPIEVISGYEEARLIYLGVTHTQPEYQKKLVIDIGGGSTEIILGKAFEPVYLNSKPFGCVSYNKRYFADQTPSKTNFQKAYFATQQKIESLVYLYKRQGWDAAIGSSGTIRAIKEVLIHLGYEDGIITPKRIQRLIKEVQSFNHIQNIKLAGLSPDRQPVFPAGIAILAAIIDTFGIDQLHFSTGALREGILYEMESRFARSDIRMRTAQNLAKKHNVDIIHAQKIKQQAQLFLTQVGKDVLIKPNDELSHLLGWSALLHEVGLSICYKGFHRHSSYILQYTYMPGFNHDQQLVLACLVRFQRKKINLKELPTLSLYDQKEIIPLIKILRLAIILNNQRQSEELPDFQLSIKYSKKRPIWQLSCPKKDWLNQNKLLKTDLKNEQSYWKKANWELVF